LIFAQIELPDCFQIAADPAILGKGCVDLLNLSIGSSSISSAEIVFSMTSANLLIRDRLRWHFQPFRTKSGLCQSGRKSLAKA
jgi:hypothetical protein